MFCLLLVACYLLFSASWRHSSRARVMAGMITVLNSGTFKGTCTTDNRPSAQQSIIAAKHDVLKTTVRLLPHSLATLHPCDHACQHWPHLAAQSSLRVLPCHSCCLTCAVQQQVVHIGHAAVHRAFHLIQCLGCHQPQALLRGHQVGLVAIRSAANLPGYQ